MSQYDIIIPHFGIKPEVTELAVRCLRSIRTYSSHEDYRLILVDNGSVEFQRVQEELQHIPHLLIRNRTNQGFIKATNQGLWSSTAPFVVLMNNDTEAAPDWLRQLQKPLTGVVGLSGPSTTTQGSWQGRRLQGPTVILDTTRMLAFFCTMIRRDVIEQVGVLDESFGVGLGDDDDYCARAQRRGYRLAFVRNLLIPHHHRTTFRTLYTDEQIKEMQTKALEHLLEREKVKAI